VVDLGNEPLANATVEVYNGTNPSMLLEDGKTNSLGLTQNITLASGINYTIRTFMRNVEVADPVSICPDRSGTIQIEAQIIDLNITVTSEDGEPLPEIEIKISYKLADRYGQLLIGEETFKTNETGNLIRLNYPANASYEIEARRDNVLFNKTSIGNLTNSAINGWVNIRIICPIVNLQVQVLDSRGKPVPNVHIDLYEYEGTLQESKVTDNLGMVQFRQLVGRYEICVYNYSSLLERRITLNRTVIDLIDNPTIIRINCEGLNLNLSILVIDQIGQPIPNAIIKIEYEGLEIRTLTVGSDGRATTLIPIGGKYRISLQILNRLCEAKTVVIEESCFLVMKVDRYIMFSGYLIEVSQLVSITLISLILLTFILLVNYERLKKFIRKSL